MTELIYQVVVLLIAVLGLLFNPVKLGPDGKAVTAKFGIKIPTRWGWILLIALVVSVMLSMRATWTKQRDKTKEINDLKIALSEVRELNASLQTNVNEVGQDVQGVSAKIDTTRMDVKDIIVSQQMNTHRLPLAEGTGKIEIELDRFYRFLQQMGPAIRDSAMRGTNKAGARGMSGSVAEDARRELLRPLELSMFAASDDCEFKIRSLLAEMGYDPPTLSGASELARLNRRYTDLCKMRDSVVSVIAGAIKRQ